MAFLFLLLTVCSYSQQKSISFSFLQDTVITSYGATFSNKLMVTNHAEGPLLLITAQPDSLALIRLPDTILLHAGEQKALFVKYLANTSLFRLTKNEVAVKYRIAGKPGWAQASFFIRTKNEQPLLLSVINTINYLNAQSNDGTVQIKCVNNGYSNLTFRLLLRSYPDGLEAIENNRTVMLQPGSQHLFIINLRNTVAQNLTPDFNLSVLAIDPLSGKELAVTYTKVLALTSEKRWAIMNNTAASLINNTAQLSYLGSNTGFNYYQLSAGGAVYPSENTQLRYRVNLNYYNQPFSGAEMYDSWIAYKNRYFGVQAGNISENLDYALFGKGVKVSVYPDSGSTISGYYVKNDYLLFSDVNQQREGATVWAGSYTYSGQNNNSSVVYLNAKDPLTGVQTDLIHTNTGWRFRHGQLLELEAGYSHEAVSDNRGISKKGYAGGMRYQQNVGKWSFLSDNYYSSPYYSGLRRGALLLQEHIDYQLATRQHLFLHYEVVNNTPSYLSKYTPAFLNSKTAKYQAGFATGAGRWQITLHPYFYTQSLQQSIINNVQTLHSASWHIAGDIAYNHAAHSFLLTTDYGNVTSNNPYLEKGNYSVWQWRFNYNNRLVGVNAFLQNNPFYLIQEPLPWQQGKFRQYSFGPYTHFTLLDKRLEGEVADNLNYYSYFQGWSNTVQGKLSFRFKRAWQLSVQVFYNTYQQYPDYNFLQTQAGIIKSFIQQNSPGYKSLSFLFFGDKNANGIWDADELPVENVIAALNESLAQSNRKGKVSFTNLKPATYKLRIQNGNGWWLLEPQEVVVTHNRTLKIPLVKTVTLPGKMVAEKNAYLQAAPSLEGITVIATDQQGSRFTTITDAEGNFSFNLPVKPFTFSVETQDSDQRVTEQQQFINIKEQGNPPIILKLVDAARKVDIKQF